MQNNCNWKESHDTVTDLFGEINCLSVVIEDKELVNPELNKQNKEVDKVESWHSRGEGDSHKDCEEHLSVSDLKDEVWTGIQVLVVILDDLGGLSSIERESAVDTPGEAKGHCLHHSEQMWEDKHSTLRSKNGQPNTDVPFGCEFVELSNKDVLLVIPINFLVRCKETVLGKQDQEGSVDVGHQEDVPGDRGIIFSCILTSLGFTNLLEDNSEDNIGKSNPTSKCLGLIGVHGSSLMPDLAILGTILKNDIKARDTINIKHLVAVAIHLSELILSWLNVIRVGFINENPICA